MLVKKIEKEDSRDLHTERPSQEQIQIEFDYLQAERITKKMLEKGLISTDEYDSIMIENRRAFSPYLAPLLT